nr:inner centromere protein-like isoform X3 [Pogona vitticeps]
MAEAKGPTHLLDVCHQKLSEFLFNAEHKCLVWLREIEEEALKMFDSNFSTEPELMPKTPSQRKHRKKKRSSFFKDENKELTRKRLSKRRSGVKTTSFQRFSPNKEEQENLSVRPGESMCHFMTSTAKEISEAQCGKTAMDQGEVNTACEQNNKWKEERGEEEMKGFSELFTGHLINGAEMTKTTGTAGSSVLPLSDPTDPAKTEEDADTHRLRSTSTPKTLLVEKPRCGEDEMLAQKLVNSLVTEGDISQDLMDRSGTPVGAPSGRHPPKRSHKTGRISLADKYSLCNKRKSTVRKSVSRAIAKKKAAQDSSSTCSRVSSRSSIEVFMEDDTINHGLLLNAESGEISNTPQKVPSGLDSPSLIISPPQDEIQQEGKCSKEEPKTQNTDVGSEDSAQNIGTHDLQNSWRRSCKQNYGQALNELPTVQQVQDEKSSHSSHKATSSPASKIMRPFKNFFQSMQKNQLLKPSGSPACNSVKRGTPSRPATKGDFVEKERQRLESLRKKQEAEQQRKEKVEEEKRRRLEEIKIKREERLRKAVQARERVEQMEEEKKKRMEKSEKLREEKMTEEKIKKKKSLKKMGEVEARKQKLLQVEGERKPHEQLEKWRTVGEIRKMLEHNSGKQEKRHHGQQEKERLVRPLELAVVTEEEENFKEEQNPVRMELQKEEATSMQTASAVSKWLNITAQKSPVGSSGQANPEEMKDMSSPKVNVNDYGMDLNSDDSTDDESQPRKPIPSWANGLQLNEAVTYQYYNPPDVNRLFGLIPSPKLEDIFYKNKPRYFKRTSSAVWQSPPLPGSKTALRASNSMKKY